VQTYSAEQRPMLNLHSSDMLSTKRKISPSPGEHAGMPRQKTTWVTSDFLALSKGSVPTVVDQIPALHDPSKEDYWTRVLDYDGRQSNQTLANGAVPFFYSSLPKSERKGSTPSSNKPQQKSKKISPLHAAGGASDVPVVKVPKKRGRPRKHPLPTLPTAVVTKPQISTREDSIADFLADVATTPTAHSSQQARAVEQSSSNVSSVVSPGTFVVLPGSSESVDHQSVSKDDKSAAASASCTTLDDNDEVTNLSFKRYFRFRLSASKLKDLKVSPDDFSVHKVVKYPRNPMEIGDIIVSINGQRIESIDTETRSAWLTGQLMPAHPMELETFGDRIVTVPPVLMIGEREVDTAVLLEALEEIIDMREDSNRELLERGLPIPVDDVNDEDSIWSLVQIAVLGEASTATELAMLREAFQQVFKNNFVFPRGR
jgi:hypothetical protein